MTTLFCHLPFLGLLQEDVSSRQVSDLVLGRQASIWQCFDPKFGGSDSQKKPYADEDSCISGIHFHAINIF